MECEKKNLEFFMNKGRFVFLRFIEVTEELFKRGYEKSFSDR